VVDSLLDEMLRVARRAFDTGLQRSTGGNFSARVPGKATFYIKGSGAGFGDMSEADILEVDEDGKPVSGRGVPSKEFRFHLGIYAVRPDVAAVLHVHAPYSIAIASCWESLPLLTDQARTKMGPVPVLPSLPGGSKELALAVTEAFRDPRISAVLMKEHGLVAVGRSIGEAENTAELIEETAQIAVLLRLLQNR